MRSRITPGLDCAHCVEELEAGFEISLGNLDRAEELALRKLELAGHSYFYQAGSYSLLARVAFLRQSWDALRTWAETGEEAARAAGEDRLLVEFLAWRTLLARLEGDERAAQGLYRRVTGHARRLGAAPDVAYYDALCAYHEAGGRPELALKMRERQLDDLSGKGQTALEVRCRIEICRMLSEMGGRLEEELALAREAASRLADPSGPLAELDRIVSDCGSSERS